MGRFVCKYVSLNQLSRLLLLLGFWGRKFRAWIFPLKAQGLNYLVRGIKKNLMICFRILMVLIFRKNFDIVFFGNVNGVKKGFVRNIE